MDFESIANLSEENSLDLYDDLLACGCMCNGVYIGDLLYGYCGSGPFYVSYCTPACRARCENGSSTCYCGRVFPGSVYEAGNSGAICTR